MKQVNSAAGIIDEGPILIQRIKECHISMETELLIILCETEKQIIHNFNVF